MTNVLGEQLAAEEVAREGVVRAYWLVMNSFILFVLLASFWIAHRWWAKCPTSRVEGGAPYFLFLFGAIALGRDYLDYRWAWRFLYPLPFIEVIGHKSSLGGNKAESSNYPWCQSQSQS
jgi:hypothetical protein